MVSITDERGVVVDWLAKMILILGILGFLAFEAGSLAVNYFGLDSKANEIALEIATDIQDGALPETNDLVIERAARALARDADAKLVAVTYDREAHLLHVTLKRSASTLLISRLGATEDWGVARSNGQAPTQ